MSCRGSWPRETQPGWGTFFVVFPTKLRQNLRTSEVRENPGMFRVLAEEAVRRHRVAAWQLLRSFST
jgi:hypothetical protein